MRTHAIRARSTTIAAAALLLAVAGCQASPSTTPSTAPSTGPAATSASAGAAYPGWYTPEPGSGGAGILAAGEHSTTGFSVPFTFTVPAGWVNDADSGSFFGLFPETPANAAEYAASGSLTNGIQMGLVDSPYFFCQALESNRGANAAEMTAAVQANDAMTVTVADVTIGGLTGTQLDVRVDPGFAGCPGDPPALDLTDGRVRGLFLDTPDRGVLVIFMTSLHAADHEAFLAAAMPIIESLRFTAAT